MHDVYGLRPPRATEPWAIARLIRIRQLYLDSNTIGNAGERFVRAAILQAGQFHDVTQQNRLGDLFDANDKNSLDLFATSANHHRFASQSKASHPFIFSDSKNITDVWVRAIARNREPWLVRCFAHASAIKGCRNRILSTVLGYQVLPARVRGRDTRALLHELAPIIGPMPFRIIAKRIDRIGWKDDKNPFAIA